MRILRGVDWRVAVGERWALIGPNGAGKTTLMGVAGAETFPSEGVASVLGHRLGTTDLRALRARIGHVDAAMAGRFRPRATALDVVRSGVTGTIVVRPDRLTGDDRRRADDLLDELGCAHLADRPFARLSRGEQQRVLLARALVAGPELLLLDEPTAGLDLPGRETFLAGLDDLARSRPELTTVHVSHHVEELPASLTHALLLRGGEVVASAPAVEALTSEALSACFAARVRVVAAGGRRLAVIERG
ncbi:MAG TPA: ATP-binding cassette domain-containing protein [Miltoncostaeaceae bacterium]|nr:ATP-binding cassette domain-containing protein [Miltoncostaeaceae bacterium]